MTDLITQLDEAMANLLASLKVDGSVEGTEAPSLLDKVRVFNAAVSWVQTRKDLAPTAPQESKFNGLRDQFVSATAPRGRGSRPGKTRKNGTPIDLGDWESGTEDA